MSVNHPFEIGGRYRTRDGDYIVTAIHGDTMTARFDDGREQALNVATQERIWRNILDDELAAAPAVGFRQTRLHGRRAARHLAGAAAGRGRAAGKIRAALSA